MAAGACGWAIDTCGCSGSSKCWDNFPPSTQNQAETLATFTMWAATGRRYGLCLNEVLPRNECAPAALYQTYSRPRTRYGRGGSLLGLDVSGPPAITMRLNGGCEGGCGCRGRCTAELPGPVHDIQEVQVDGDTVDPSTYEVHNGLLLVRKDGCWPTCQVYGTEVPGFVVTYHRGLRIPAAVQLAAELLACEYAKACEGGACRLPSRLTSLARQGVDIQVDPSIGVDKTGKAWVGVRTGIAQVDAIIDADNPTGRPAPLVVLSPDLPTSRVVTWASGS
jgi:hypothetical protein